MVLGSMAWERTEQARQSAISVISIEGQVNRLVDQYQYMMPAVSHSLKFAQGHLRE